MEEQSSSVTCTAFAGAQRIATGDVSQVTLSVKAFMDRGETLPVLAFDDHTGHAVELDLRGSVDDILQRLADRTPVAPPRAPGRPKLGVVAREVTLLPRHWEWLAKQPGGASVALRKLVEDARRSHEGRDTVREAQEAVYRFMSAMAGNLPGFEEASRALFANDPKRFSELIAAWPAALRDHAHRMSERAFS
jgi:hypothetical protein